MGAVQRALVCEQMPQSGGEGSEGTCACVGSGAGGGRQSEARMGEAVDHLRVTAVGH